MSKWTTAAKNNFVTIKALKQKVRYSIMNYALIFNDLQEYITYGISSTHKKLAQYQSLLSAHIFLS